MAEGDPRVHFVMNLVLSAIYATVIVWGLDLLDLATFTVQNVAVGTLIVMALTYLVVLR